MRPVLIWILAALVLGGLAFIRLVPSDPARWHVDPVTVADPAKPHFARLVPGMVTGADVASLAAAADAAMLALPRTTLLAGSVAQGHMTYITRSRLMGYPDYTSIRVLPGASGATLGAFARSRFGTSDLGVNAARLDRLKTALTTP
jgi:hypothetical protein